MLVAGGTYEEYCIFPEIDQLYGSGLRAACAISDITESTNCLVTFLDFPNKVDSYAKTHNFEVENRQIPETVQFEYIHNFSEPRIYPDYTEIEEKVLGPVEDSAILRFGMIEGSSVVHGNKVVYDPQSPEIEGFSENGSTADELALVLNKSEGSRLTQENHPEQIVEKLMRGEQGCDVAVLKCGPYGAVVGSEEGIDRIPVYPTSSVMNIGSGDIFSAVFAAYWAENHLPPNEAAKKASFGTAYYSLTGVLPIPKSYNEQEKQDFDELLITENENPPQVYLAGPFFGVGEFYLVEEIREAIRSLGADVFSPFHEVGFAGPKSEAEKIAWMDLEGLEESDVLFAILDGEDPGTYFEIGYAKKLGLPIIAYQNNPTQTQNMMLEGTGTPIHDELASALYNTIWTHYA